MAQAGQEKAHIEPDKQAGDETLQTPVEALTEQTAYTRQEAQNNIPPGTKVKVIVNPASGKKAGFITTNAAGVEEVRAALEANNIEADIVQTEYPNHATRLAREAVKAGYQVIIACGGDGTIAEVATALIKKDVTLGILPIGSANNVARMMHVPFDLNEAAKLLRLGEVRRVDVGRCNGQYFLETAGVGLDAALFPILNHLDHGEYIRLIDVARVFFKFRPRRITLMLDGRIMRMRALVVLVANGPYWGYSVPLAPDAKVDDRKFDVVVFRNFSKLAFVRHILVALFRRDISLEPSGSPSHKRYRSNPRLKTYRASHVRVFTSRRHPWPVHADAKARGHTPARIDVVPGSLCVITGPGEHVTTPPSLGIPQGKPPRHRLKRRK